MKFTQVQKLLRVANKSNQHFKHAAALVKNGKTIICKPNSTRTKYSIGNDKHINCSQHAEMSALSDLLKRWVLKAKGRKKRFLRE